MAKQMGEKAEAQRLFDRAMVEFEKKSGNEEERKQSGAGHPK